MSDIKTEATILQFLASSTRQALFAYDIGANQFTYLNPAFEQLFGMTKESKVNSDTLLQMVHPEDRQYVRETYQKLLNEKSCEGIEFRVQSPEEGERWMCLTPFLSGNAPGQNSVVGYVEDITTSKRYIEYLNKFGNKKDSVLHILAHDLAGPFAMIQSLSGALAEEAKVFGSQQIDRLIGLIENMSVQGGDLIKDLLNHEFLETTGVDLVKQRANLVARLEEIMEQYRQSEEQINKSFHFFPSSREIFIEFDNTKLIQAINNLISNAIKFTKDGGEITVRLEEKEETVIIQVADNGIGIPAKYHAVLFDKFTPARRPGLDGEPSVGLGMSIVKTIVEWHNGKIWFESEEGRGTIFYIQLPKE